MITGNGVFSQARRWLRDRSRSRLRNGRERMTDMDRHRQGADCSAMASAAETHEIRQTWITIERSYRFLIEREERIARTKSDALAG